MKKTTPTKTATTKKETSQHKKIIKKNMIIADILRKYPDTIDVFMKYGVSCAFCPYGQLETLEQGIMGHGLDPDKFEKELNEFLETQQK